jgi:SAM-dependent MidA family methyltransferase
MFPNKLHRGWLQEYMCHRAATPIRKNLELRKSLGVLDRKDNDRFGIIVIDEVSMITPHFLEHINSRLKQAAGLNVDYGGTGSPKINPKKPTKSWDISFLSGRYIFPGNIRFVPQRYDTH